MDCMNLTYPRESFDFVLDKSTIDALLCGPDAFLNTAKMLKEVQRVLKTGGVYMAITYGEPKNRLFHFQRSHLHVELKQFYIENPYKKHDAVHYVFVCKKLEGADEVADKEWAAVEYSL